MQAHSCFTGCTVLGTFDPPHRLHRSREQLHAGINGAVPERSSRGLFVALPQRHPACHNITRRNGVKVCIIKPTFSKKSVQSMLLFFEELFLPVCEPLLIHLPFHECAANPLLLQSESFRDHDDQEVH